MIERIFHPYNLWEDWGVGMYRERGVLSQEVLDAVAVLSDPARCRAAMQRVVKEWPRATEHHLTDRARNRRAWLGRAAVCIETGSPESVTRAAWPMLTPLEQEQANNIATATIREWEAARAQATANV